MASQSAHFNLTKPATTDNYDIAVFNGNTDIIDTQLYNNQQNAAKVMVGATPQADGESGRVPAPSAGDEDKYLKADGTWGTPSGGGGGSSTLVGLTDVDISSPTNGQVLKYNSVTQKWENADESGSSQRTYLGQLIPRVSASDFKITASTSNSSYSAWGAFNGTSPSNLSNPSANSCWLPEANLTDQWIKYHFDAQRYFTKIGIVCFSNYSSNWVGDIKVEGSTDGSTWENILASGTTYELTAELQNSTIVEINLDDTDLWEYIRVIFVDEMSVAYQPSCFVDEIYVYGGEENSGSSSAEEMTLAEYNALTTEQKNDGTIRFIPESSIGIITPIDMSNPTDISESSNIVITPSEESVEMTWDTYASSGIAATFYYSRIDVTNYDYLVYDLVTGDSYDSLHPGSETPIRDLGIGLCSSAPSTWAYAPNVNWTIWNRYGVTDTNRNLGTQTLDVSELSGEYYLVIAGVAWETTISNLKYTTSGGNPSQIKYMGKTYADGTGGGGNPELEETALLTTPITAAGTYTLLDNIEDYDFVSFVSGASNEADIRLLAVSDMLNMLDDNLVINCAGTGGRWFNITALSGTSMTIAKYSETIIHSIIGYKIKGGGGSSSHTYSTTEQKVGTWIDGSDVYEKSYQISLPSSFDASNAWIVEADGSFIEGILSFECTIKTSGGLIMSAGSNAPGWHFTLHRNGNNQLVLQSGNGNELMNGTAYIIIRYTKVTQGGE